VSQLPLVNGRVLDVRCGALPYRALLGPNASDHKSAKSCGMKCQRAEKGTVHSIFSPLRSNRFTVMAERC
jgi:hypothetical protein